MTINVTLAFILVGPMGLAGIGLAIAVGSWAEVLVLLAVLGHRFGAFDAAGVLRSGLLPLVGAGIATAIAWVVMTGFGRAVGSQPARPVLLVEIALASGLAGLAYLGLSRAFRLAELATMLRLVAQALGRQAAS